MYSCDQPLGALPREGHALLEGLERTLERQVAAFETLHQPLESLERLLEAERFGRSCRGRLAH